MRALIAILFAAGLALSGSGQEEKKPDEKKPDEKKPEEKKPELIPRSLIEGEYTVTSGEQDGLPLNPDLLRDMIVRVGGNRIVAKGRDKTPFLDATYTLDTTKLRWGIEMKMAAPQEGTTTGLVDRQGDLLYLAYALPGSDPPKEFRGGKGQVLLVLRVLSIEGGYTIGSAERDGKPVPADEFKDAIVRITNSRIIGTDRDRNEFLSAAYTLNMNKTPWELELKLTGPRDETTRALVRRDGHTLTLIYARSGAEAPKEFKTKEGQVMFVLRGFILDPTPPPNKFSSSP